MIQRIQTMIRALTRFLSAELTLNGSTGDRLERELAWEISVSSALAALYKPLIAENPSIEEMARIVLDQARRLTGSTHGFVASNEAGSGARPTHSATAMYPAPTEGAGADGCAHLRRSGSSRGGLCALAAGTHQAFFTNIPARHPAFSGYPGSHVPVRRLLVAPVLLGGRAVGQIVLANAAQPYTRRDLKAVQRLAGFYALALQRRQGQQQMRDALREKEVLLREIHHRVKNNLQVISSLLNLQAGSMSDAAAIEMLKESQNRVRSMAMVHEQLHRSGDLSRIRFSEYVRNLIASLFCSYGIDSTAVALELEVARAHLPIDVAVPCGLIIQELVSNSLKHAFPGDRRGRLNVSLQPVGETGEPRGDGRRLRWALTIADDGVGLPASVDKESSNSLGLRLVRILTEQLGGSVHCRVDSGTAWRVEFETESRENQES